MIATEVKRRGKSPSSEQASAFLTFADLEDQRVVVIHTGEQANRDAGARATLQRAHNEALVADNPIDPEVEPEQTLYVKPAQLDEGGRLHKMTDRDATKRVIVHQFGNLPPEKAKRLIVALREQAPRTEIYLGKQGQNAEPWQLVDVIALEQELAPTSSPRKKEGPAPMIDKMSASQRAELLTEQLGNVAINIESERVYHYSGSLWEPLADIELRRQMAAIFTEHDVTFSDKGITSAVATMKLMIPTLGQPSPALIGFANGVYDMEAHHFRPHSPADCLLNHNGIHYGDPLPGESLMRHAPNFTKWLSHAAGNDYAKVDRILAALYMVLANRYDWQMFLEVTGEGGSGKSVMANLCGLLVGGENVGSSSMKRLESDFGLESVWDKRLIVLPDQPSYVGDGATLKAITGGDEVPVNPKGKKAFNAVVRAVVMATNNEPMVMTERNGGIARRRVIFPFNNVVADADRDENLGEKIATELPVIIRHLLAQFANPELARRLLLEQRDSPEALAVKQEADPVTAMCALLEFLDEIEGMMVGGGNINVPDPRRYLYHFYQEFLKDEGREKALHRVAFGRAMRNGAKAHGKEYKTRKSNGESVSNVKLREEAIHILPRVRKTDD
ncbi:DNA primase family protein [Aeromonas enteropelogenes]|uniref:DNA primase family protein n=1 Tax=Aeromonas enteropelogenes TaxID=29489 RepID=UPI003BA3D99F